MASNPRDLHDRIEAALEHRLERNYGDTLGGITSVVVGDLDVPMSQASRVLAALADRDDATLSPGDLRVEHDPNARKNLQHWRVTRVEGGEASAD